MRVRLDVHGRPKPAASSTPPYPAAPSPSSSSAVTPHAAATTSAAGSTCAPSAPSASSASSLPSAPSVLSVTPTPTLPHPPLVVSPTSAEQQSEISTVAATSAEHAKRASSFARDGSFMIPPASIQTPHSLPSSARPPVLPSPTSPSFTAHPRASVSATHTDDASDSGSSSATEAYNSEDEHPARAEPSEVPIRTLREREADFAAMLSGKTLRIVEMRPDGNCLFRALAHSVWNDEERHAAVRASVMQYLLQERDYFSQFVAEDFVRYIRRKSREGTHGNHLELQAAAELFGRPIEVYSYAATPSTIIDSWGTPADPSRAPEPIRLSFHRGNHYNAVLPSNTEKNAKRSTELFQQAQWRVPPEQPDPTQAEIERAVLALSLVEATRGEAVAGSASSSAAAVPNTVLALVNSGYSEDNAFDAHRVAGHGGLSEMVRYLASERRGSSAVQSRPRRHQHSRNISVRKGPPSSAGSSASAAPASSERREDSSSPSPRFRDQAPVHAEGSADGSARENS